MEANEALMLIRAIQRTNPDAGSPTSNMSVVGAIIWYAEHEENYYKDSLWATIVSLKQDRKTRKIYRFPPIKLLSLVLQVMNRDIRDSVRKGVAFRFATKIYGASEDGRFDDAWAWLFAALTANGARVDWEAQERAIPHFGKEVLIVTSDE